MIFKDTFEGESIAFLDSSNVNGGFFFFLNMLISLDQNDMILHLSGHSLGRAQTVRSSC